MRLPLPATLIPRTARLRTGTRGYSLIEILVVIGIILIVVTLLIGGYADMVAARRLSSSVDRVLQTIAEARSLAIADKQITHVRIENRGPNDQWIGVYRFPKVGEALQAVSEKAVQDKGGWKEPLAKQLDKQRLESGIYFETQYDPALMWNESRRRPKPGSQTHATVDTLYYSGTWTASGGNPYAAYSPDAAGDAINLLPKTATYSGGALMPPTPHGLLYFLPDGSASGNFIIFVRDEEHLRWVQIWRGGVVRSGDIAKQTDFDKLN